MAKPFDDIKNMENYLNFLQYDPWKGIILSWGKEFSYRSILYFKIFYESYADLKFWFDRYRVKENVLSDLMRDFANDLDQLALRVIGEKKFADERSLGDKVTAAKVEKETVDNYWRKKLNFNPESRNVDWDELSIEIKNIDWETVGSPFMRSVCGRGIELRIKGFTDNVRTAIGRVAYRLADLREVFREVNDESSEITELTKISGSRTETHRGGEGVLFLTFGTKSKNQTKCIVYKPTDMEIDFLIYGDSQALTRSKSHGSFLKRGDTKIRSLVEIYNLELGRSQKKIKTHKIIPYGWTTEFGPRRDESFGRTKWRGQYGFGDFIEPPQDYSAVEEKLFSADVTISPGTGRGVWTEAQIHDFYLRAGHLLAIACAIGLTDQHGENVLTHMVDDGVFPHLIDLEVCLTKKINALTDTSFVSTIESDKKLGGIDGTMTSTTRRYEIHNETQVELARFYNLPRNRLYSIENGRLRFIGVEWASVRDGFNEGQRTLRRISERKQKNGFSEWLQSINGALVRIVPENTSTFKSTIEMILDIDPEDKEGYSSRQILEDIVSKLQPYDWRHKFTEKQIKEVWRRCQADFKRLDIPVFYNIIGTQNLYDSYGNITAKDWFTETAGDKSKRIKTDWLRYRGGDDPIEGFDFSLDGRRQTFVAEMELYAPTSRGLFSRCATMLAGLLGK